MTEIAKGENITDNYVSNLIHLAWLPPKMVESILDGHPQATTTVRTLMLKRDIDSDNETRDLMKLLHSAWTTKHFFG